MTHDFTDFGPIIGHNARPSVTAKTDDAPQIVTWIAYTMELGSPMVSNSKRRRRRGGWRFFLGISVVGALIFASASHAGNRLLARGKTAQHGWYLLPVMNTPDGGEHRAFKPIGA